MARRCGGRFSLIKFAMARFTSPRAVAAFVRAARARDGARVLGFDVGARRIGIARSDPLATFAEPHGLVSIARTPRRDAAARDAATADAARELVARVARARAIALVVGWPLQMDGSEGAQCAQVDGVVRALFDAGLDVPVAAWDERLTTDAARQLAADAHGVAFVSRAERSHMGKRRRRAQRSDARARQRRGAKRAGRPHTGAPGGDVRGGGRRRGAAMAGAVVDDIAASLILQGFLDFVHVGGGDDLDHGDFDFDR